MDNVRPGRLRCLIRATAAIALSCQSVIVRPGISIRFSKWRPTTDRQCLRLIVNDLRVWGHDVVLLDSTGWSSQNSRLHASVSNRRARLINTVECP